MLLFSAESDGVQMKILSLAILLSALFGAGAAQAEMTVQLQDPWDGKTVPDGQQCPLFGGKGATPPMTIKGMPAGTVEIDVAFNDKSYPPLSEDGGHGVIGFKVSGETADLPSVPGLTAAMPDGARLVSKARSTDAYASPGYLPPCSGGNGNRYAADVSAIGSDGAVLQTVTIDIGHY
jgi:hypothetical protein